MLNIELLTRATNLYLSNFDTINRQSAIETAFLSINESVVELQTLKDLLKNQQPNLSVANILSLCLSISSYTIEIKETIRYLETHQR